MWAAPNKRSRRTCSRGTSVGSKYGVAESAMVGLSDARWGEVPVAVLVRTSDAAGQALNAEAVLQHLQSRIARFKLPRRVVFLGNLPKSALGKVQKPALQAELTRTNP